MAAVESNLIESPSTLSGYCSIPGADYYFNGQFEEL